MPSDTSNYKLKRPDFDVSPWDDDMNNNAAIIDSVLGTILKISSFQGIYATSTIYEVGDVCVDSATFEVYTCKVAHTSHASNTFAVERAAHTTYWEVSTLGITGVIPNKVVVAMLPTLTGTITVTGSISGITELTVGLEVVFIPQVFSNHTNVVKFNLNSLGAYPILIENKNFTYSGASIDYETLGDLYTLHAGALRPNNAYKLILSESFGSKYWLLTNPSNIGASASYTGSYALALPGAVPENATNTVTESSFGTITLNRQQLTQNVTPITLGFYLRRKVDNVLGTGTFRIYKNGILQETRTTSSLTFVDEIISITDCTVGTVIDLRVLIDNASYFALGSLENPTASIKYNAVITSGQQKAKVTSIP